MTYALRLAEDPHFRFDASLIRSLHFMMLRYDLAQHPGACRPGAIFVRDERRGEVVYEGPDSERIPDLIDELVSKLRIESDSTSCMLHAAMAHLRQATTTLQRRREIRLIWEELEAESAHPLAVLVPRNVSIEHGLTFRQTRISNRFVTDLPDGIGKHRKDCVGSVVARTLSDVGLEATRHDQDFARPQCSPRDHTRLSLARRALGRVGHTRSAFFDGPGLTVAFGREMDLPTIDRAEKERRSLAIAGRNAADPIDTAERNVILTGATTPPSFRHASSSQIPLDLAGFNLPPGRPNRACMFGTRIERSGRARQAAYGVSRPASLRGCRIWSFRSYSRRPPVEG